MVKVKHPDEQCNIAQEAHLNNLVGEYQELARLMFSHGNASYLYYNEGEEPTMHFYKEWLLSLRENLRKEMEILGFDGCKNMLSLRRYVNERKDIGMADFVKKLMGEEDYNKYMNLVNKG